MRTVAVFHPSAELYGADRILVNALKALPTDVCKRVYLFRHGPLSDYLLQNVENAEVVVRNDMPVIYRAIFSPLGIAKTILNTITFIYFILIEHKKYRFRSAYVNTSANVLILPLLKILGIRNYIHIHEIIDSPKLVGWLTAFISRWFSSRVVCVSGAVQQGMMRYVGGIEKVSVVIHNGIEPIKVAAQSSERTGMNFYLFGRIQVRKGHWFLVDALSRIPKRVLASTKFILMGGIVPGQEQDLKALHGAIEKTGLCEFVEIKDFAADISDPMSNADVCLVPSLVKDSFPTTVIESMSAGRPVITTNNGGAKEAMINNETGFLVDPGNVDQLADAIMRMIMNRQKTSDMGMAAQQRFKDQFTLEHFKADWLRMINDDHMLTEDIDMGKHNAPVLSTQ